MYEQQYFGYMSQGYCPWTGQYSTIPNSDIYFDWKMVSALFWETVASLWFVVRVNPSRSWHLSRRQGRWSLFWLK